MARRRLGLMAVEHGDETRLWGDGSESHRDRQPHRPAAEICAVSEERIPLNATSHTSYLKVKTCLLLLKRMVGNITMEDESILIKQ